MEAKTENNNKYKVIIYVAGAFFAYKLMQKLGLIGSKEDKDAAALIDSQFLTSEPFIKWMKQNKTKGGIPFINYINNPAIRAYFLDSVNAIWESKGFFNDDEEKVFSVFRSTRIPSKIHLSAIAYYFNYLYGRSLNSFLEGFLNESELSKIYSIIEKKPNTFKISIDG